MSVVAHVVRVTESRHTQVEFVDRNVTVIAVRGTEFWRVSDWLEDVRMWTGIHTYVQNFIYSICIYIYIYMYIYIYVYMNIYIS